MLLQTLFQRAAVAFTCAAWIGCQYEVDDPGDTEPMEADWALVHANVIDATGAPLQTGMTVAVQGDRVVCVRRDGQCRLPEHTELVDAGGRYVIPGLADMHVHNDPSIAPSVYIANGVTLIREMSGAPFVLEWREQARNGVLLGPRIVAGSPMMDGSPSLWENTPASFVRVGDESAARELVRQAKGQGYDFVKIYSRLSRDVYRAIADEARAQQIPIAGHAPDGVPISEASALGQKSFEHLFGLAVALSEDEAALRERIGRIELDVSGFTGYPSWFKQMLPIAWEAGRSYSDGKAKSLFAQLAADGSAQVPTLTSLRLAYVPAQLNRSDERTKYVSTAMIQGWDWQVDEIYKAGLTEEEASQRHELFEQTLMLVGRLHDAGVRILAGTDCATPYVFHGFSLHDELQWLVLAGLTPMEALQSATLEPARFLAQEGSMGTVQEGRVADLVVLDANPLDDIGNTRAIHAVAVGGRLVTASERQRLLAELEAAASRPAADPQ